MRRLPVRRRVPVRRWVRLARLRRLSLRWLRLLLAVGPLPRLLKDTTRSNPMGDKSPSQHCAAGRGSIVLVCPPNGGNQYSSERLARVNSKVDTTELLVLPKHQRCVVLVYCCGARGMPAERAV